MEFPAVRLRRTRRSGTLRRLLKEQRLGVDDLVQTIHLAPGESFKRPLASVPGVFELSSDHAVGVAERAASRGVGAVYLTGVPTRRDREGSGAWNANGVVHKAIALIKDAVPDLCVLAEVSLGPYTEHGHPGVVVEEELDNDETLERLTRVATSLARSGADVIVPVGLIDGTILACREMLDEEGFDDIALVAAAAAFASGYDAPERSRWGDQPTVDERAAYSIAPENGRDAVRAVSMQTSEGADLILVQPAMAYLDIVSELRETFEHPIIAMSTVGEVAMVEASSQSGWCDRRQLICENLACVRRAGADLIVTPWATEVASWLAPKDDDDE